MKKISLSAEKRTVIGKKVKNLRGAHIIPANIFGKKIQSSAVQISEDDFTKVYKEVGETGLVELSLEGEIRPVLVTKVQMHPVTRVLLHVDFHQVDLKEKVKAHVPIELVGDAPAVVNKEGLLLELLDKLEVETFPTDLPEKIKVDITSLVHVGDTISVADLKVSHVVTLLTSGETEIVKVGELVSKEAEALAQEEAAAAAAQAQETATSVEGTAPTAPEVGSQVKEEEKK